jgi:hypothetical protein
MDSRFRGNDTQPSYGEFLEVPLSKSPAGIMPAAADEKN